MKLSLSGYVVARALGRCSFVAVVVMSATAGCAPAPEDTLVSESDDLVAARIYDCSAGANSRVEATLYFTADGRLKGTTVRGTPYAKTDWSLRRDFRELTGRNSAAEYFHARWPVRSDGLDLSVEISFKTRVRSDSGWTTLGLDASLLGFDQVAGGARLGKLRLDVEAAEGDFGSTYHLSCLKTK